jgi:hypothetical protein
MKSYPKNLSAEARKLAEELEKRGISRVDFIREFYDDVTTILTSVAFDGKGERTSFPHDTLPFRPYDSLDTLTLKTHTPPNFGLYSYSPENHTVMEVGDIDTGYYFEGYEGIERDCNGLPFPSPILDKNYEDIIQILTWQPDLSSEVVRHYATHENVKVRKAVATNPNTPSDILEQLANDSEQSVRVAVAKNPAIPELAYELLVKDHDRYIKNAIAENSGVPASVLVELVKQPLERLMLYPKDTDMYNESMVKTILGNDNFPIDILLEWYKLFKLFKDNPKADILAQALAANPTISFDLAAELNEHPNKLVRRALAENHKTPLDILQKLGTYDSGNTFRQLNFADDASSLENYIEKNPASDKANLGFYSYLLLNSTVPTEILIKILMQLPRDELSIRHSLANNKNTPITILEELANDHTEWGEGRKICNYARAQLFKKKLLTEEQLREYWQEVQHEYGEYGYWTPQVEFAPSQYLLSLIQDSLPDLQDEQGHRSREHHALYNSNFPLEAVINHPRRDLRQYVAGKKKTTPQQLEQLSKDPAWQVRMEVARNLNTPPHVLEMLAKDEHPSVQGAVKQNLAAPRHLLKRSSKMQ